MTNGKMIYVWGEPTFVVSNFDPSEGHTPYSGGCVVTTHYDDLKDAGSLSRDGALFIGSDELSDLIKALEEFVKE